MFYLPKMLENLFLLGVVYVFIDGEVNSPGVYELHNDKPLKMSLSLLAAFRLAHICLD